MYSGNSTYYIEGAGRKRGSRKQEREKEEKGATALFN